MLAVDLLPVLARRAGSTHDAPIARMLRVDAWRRMCSAAPCGDRCAALACIVVVMLHPMSCGR
eukprot:6424030-Alexandrium_andersonii.AAC.1